MAAVREGPSDIEQTQEQIGLDWIGLDSLFSQGRPLADGYYTRHPEDCTEKIAGKKEKKEKIQPLM